ncbi:MAG TPA: helix-turn-helix transcriptional regulator [Pseudonocardiaceae bacterium]|nr:helix-turn-helix transcriptional regulator [Pseudonocardiaceae bacterium]
MPRATENTGQLRPAPGRSLRELREAAGLNQMAVAEQVKRELPGARFSQPALSRAEQGKGRLAADVVRALCQIYRVTGAQRAALIQEAEDAEAGYVDARVVLQAGNTVNLQQRFARLEHTAVEIRSFNPVMVLGVLQTPAYAATVFGTSGDDPLVAGRMARQRELLADRHRHWTLIQTEGALRWQARSAAVMVEQTEHLIQLSYAPQIEIGVIDWRSPNEVFPHTAFHVYDDTAVVVATRDGTAIINDRARIADYRGLFDQLCGTASFGHTAREILRRLADDYRSV